MSGPFPLTDPERHFLRHWTYEAKGPFWGPATIWCINHRVNPAYGPYPLAELFWEGEREADRAYWTGDRPPVPFRVPWQEARHFWHRVNAALSQIPHLRDDPRFTPSAFTRQVGGALTHQESNFLRAYNAEMVWSGSGRHIQLACRRGVQDHHLIPFFVLLDGLSGPATVPADFPWADFPARYKELSRSGLSHLGHGLRLR